MLILCNQYKLINPEFKLTADLNNVLVKLIDRHQFYEEVI